MKASLLHNIRGLPIESLVSSDKEPRGTEGGPASCMKLRDAVNDNQAGSRDGGIFQDEKTMHWLRTQEHVQQYCGF